jgi:phosphoenolpyruvate carboxykinase (GTP)
VTGELLRVNVEDWKKEADEVEKFFNSLGPRMPWELRNELEALRNRLDGK